MNKRTLQELFVEQIRDLYDAEKQLVKALPQMAKNSESEDLANALKNHLEETKGQVQRLEKVFTIVNVTPRGKACKAMKGLIEEGNEGMEEHEKGALRDLSIIAAGQRVEHYEMAAYGTARTLAEHLELDDAVQLLQETEDEEKNADDKLNEVAMELYAAGEESESEAETTGAHAGSRNARPKSRSAG
jgi:ferritin-like metal-binding protein YciE